MVAMDANDPESFELASEILRANSHEFGSVIRNSIYGSWLRLKDLDAVESKYRGFFDRALLDFRRDPNEYMLSINMGRQSPSEQPVDDHEEQQIRIALYIFWIGLPPQRRNYDTLDVGFREIMDDALSGLRDDPDAFGSEFHWTSE